MATQLEPARLIDGIQSLLDRFKDELTGPRQATRTQLIRYLARRLGVGEQAAGRIFGELEHAGVIQRRDQPFDGFGARVETQRWAVDLSQPDGMFLHLEPAAPDAGDEPELKALELLRSAIRHRATDVHLDPFGDEVEIRFRIDGRLEHFRRLDATLGRQVMAQFKVLAELDPVEPFHAHEGRLRLPLDLYEYDVRITTVPVTTGEAVALRLLGRDQIIRPLSGLGLSDAVVEQARAVVRSAEGVVLVAGPAGSGKTTTLYSLVHDLDDGRRNIVTIEDPVEYVVPQFLQIEVDPRHGRSPAASLKTVLRMDADVILLAEIRDAETAAAALMAAGCGKLVLTTVHARDAAAAITVLRQLAVDDWATATNVRGIISERLVRRVCTSCRGERPPTDAEAEFFTAAGAKVPQTLPIAAGCDQCRGTGYSGRVGVFEVARIDADLAEAVASGRRESELRTMLRERGVAGLRSDALEKAADGVTTLEELEAVSWPE
jgi:type II secretory ATPase GspE/PulE/Tfp pilus assembly ATPase PilB-like protein